MKHRGLIFLYFYNMIVDRVHKGNDLKSANQSFNQFFFLLWQYTGHFSR
jgi:hypothetical protein